MAWHIDESLTLELKSFVSVSLPIGAESIGPKKPVSVFVSHLSSHIVLRVFPCKFNLFITQLVLGCWKI